MARQRCVVTAMVRQLDPQTVVLNFGDIAKATKGVFRTDIPQGALASLADLAVRTKQQKITSVNFVPPLIKPWSYDPAVVRATVDRAIAAQEKASEEAAAKAEAADDATASGASPSPAPARRRGRRRPRPQEAGRHGPSRRPTPTPTPATSPSVCSAG